MPPYDYSAEDRMPIPLSDRLASIKLPPPEGSEHRGMFGIHGKGRNILGLLGDAFLVQSGNKPMFHPRMMQEREADAMQGFVQDPMGAAARLAKENPDAAREFYLQNIQQQRLARDSNADYENMVNDRAVRLLGTHTAQNYPRLKEQVLRYMQAHKVQPNFELPEAYDPDLLESIRNSGVPVDNQIDNAALSSHRQAQEEDADLRRQEMADFHRDSLDVRREYNRVMGRQGDRRLDVTESDPRRVDPRDRPPTAETVIGRIMDKQSRGGTLTSGEQTTLKEYRASRGRPRRERPATVQRRINPDGSVSIRRMVNGKWVESR